MVLHGPVVAGKFILMFTGQVFQFTSYGIVKQSRFALNMEDRSPSLLVDGRLLEPFFLLTFRKAYSIFTKKLYVLL